MLKAGRCRDGGGSNVRCAEAVNGGDVMCATCGVDKSWNGLTEMDGESKVQYV